MEALIECTNLKAGYNHKEVIKDISFSVCEGDYLLIVGANGAGKSTLMKTILGLTPPLGGKIEYLNGIKKTDIGYLPQQNAIQRDFPTSVYEVVLSGCLNKLGYKPFYTKKEKDIALKNIERLKLQDIKKKSFKELSGGQKQRVLLARALSATDKILLLDEPVNGLDPEITKEFYQLIKELNQDDKLTIIMISHDLDKALNDANKVLKLDSNYFFGNKDDFIKHYKEELELWYLKS